MSIEDGHVNFYFSKLLREAIKKKFDEFREIQNISYAKFIERLIWKGLKK